MRRSIVVVGIAALLLGVAVVAFAESTTPTPQVQAHCFHHGRGVRHVALAGNHVGEYEHTALAGRTWVDGRRAVWRGQQPYVLVVGGGPNVCITGGTITGTWSQQTPWRTMHSTAAVVVSGPGATVEDIRVHDYGDSLRFVDQAQGWVVRRVELSDSRDDCIENDWLHSGTVEDSLLNGCYNAFSARTYSDQSGVSDGSSNLVTVRHTLVRLRPMARTYNGEDEPGTAGFFKWDPAGPMLSLHDDVFRADMRAATVGLGIPRGKLADCSNNVMVWLGNGPYPRHLPACFRVTHDRAVWTRAVQAWHRDYGPGVPWDAALRRGKTK